LTFVDCYSCANPAINGCKRCARAYCDDHGNAQYCAECLRPASAIPSSNLYFGALLVMLVGTALAVYLIVRPPGDDSDASTVVGQPSATPRAEATPEVTSAPTTAAETPAATPSPATPEATAGPTESPFITYTVAEGDSLFSIAEAHLPPGDDIIAYLNAIATLNGLDPDAADLQAGDEILLPPVPE
jgi:LysM repeat protein